MRIGSGHGLGSGVGGHEGIPWDAEISRPSSLFLSLLSGTLLSPSTDTHTVSPTFKLRSIHSNLSEILSSGLKLLMTISSQ